MDNKEYRDIERRSGGERTGGADVAIALIKWVAIVAVVLVIAYVVLNLVGVIEGVF